MTRRVFVLTVLLVLLTLAPIGSVTAQEQTATPTAGGPNESTETPTVTPNTSTTADPATPTPTPDGSDTNNGGGDSGSGPAGSTQADLTIRQPDYVDQPVETTDENGTTVYQARGETLRITLENADASAVQNFGVEESEASLSERDGTYILEPEADGTYHLFWQADGEVYEAVISVEAASYVHLSEDEYEALQEDADNWEWVLTQFQRAGLLDRDASVEQAKAVIGDAVDWYEFYVSPFAALTGGFISIALLLVQEPGGWLFLAMLLLLFGVATFGSMKKIRTYRRQFKDVEDLDEAQREKWELDIKRAYSAQTLQDLGLTDGDAAAVKEHLDISNPRQLLERIVAEFGATRVIRTILDAYDQLGYAVRVERDAEGEITSAHMAPPETVAADVEVLGGDDDLPATDGGDLPATEFYAPAAAPDDVLLRLEWDQLDADKLWHPEVDAEGIDPPVSNSENTDTFDFITEAGVPVGEDGTDHYVIERREEFVDILIEVVEHSAASAYTDPEGRVRPEVDFVEFIHQFVSVSSEKYRLPLWHLRDVLIFARSQLDDNERLNELAERSRSGEL